MATLPCWQPGSTSQCSTSPQVPREESATAGLQLVPTSCLTNPAALGWHLSHLSTLFSGRSSARLGLWLCPLPLVPTAGWMAGLFPLAIRDLSKASCSHGLLCFPHPHPHIKSGHFLSLLPFHKPQSATQTQSSYFLTQRTSNEDKLVPARATDPVLNLWRQPLRCQKTPPTHTHTDTHIHLQMLTFWCCILIWEFIPRKH